MDAQIQADEEQQNINIVTRSVRLPAFYEEDPSLWFLQADAIFSAERVQSQARKAQLVIGQLPFKILTQVTDLARDPGDNPYETLKERLITTFSQSQERKLIQLLEGTELGDLKPSHLLRKMQTLAGPAASLEIIRTVWIRALPSRVRSILASLPQDNLDQLAVTADRIVEIDSPTPIMASQPLTGTATLLEQLTNQLANLKTQIDDLRKDTFRDDRRSRSRSRQRNRQQSPARKTDQLCFYHRRFAQAANVSNPAHGKTKEIARKTRTGCGNDESRSRINLSSSLHPG